MLAAGCLVPSSDWDGESGGGTAGSTASDTTASVDATDAGDDDGATDDGATGDGTTDNGTTDGTDGGDDDGSESLLPSHCDGLSAVPDDAIVVTPDDNDALAQIVADAPSGSTVALSPGTYDRQDQDAIVLATPGVTLRSTTSDALDVILDAGGSNPPFVIVIRADDIIIADITVQNAQDNLIEIQPPDGGLSRPSLYRLGLHDAGSVKILAQQSDDGSAWTTAGEIACSTMTMTEAFRESQTDCTAVGSVRVHGGRDWVLRDSLIRDHWCASGSYATVAFDHGARDTTIVRNRLFNNYRGILLGGDPEMTVQPAGDTACGVSPAQGWGHLGGLIENNLIWVTDPLMAVANPAFPGDSMIAFWRVCGAAALHNTIVNDVGLFNAIEWRFSETSVTVANNLTTDTLMARNGAFAYGVPSNATGVEFTEFVDVVTPDLHLAADALAIDAGFIVPGQLTEHDFEGNPRVGAPDVGAYEFTR